MIEVERFGKVEIRGRGDLGKKSERKGSMKFVVLKDGSVIKWWKGIWRFSKERWDRDVSKSLYHCSMVDSIEKGKWVKDEERYEDFEKFSKRMVGILGVDQFIKVINWIKS